MADTIKRLVGNPNVVTNAYGDTSYGFTLTSEGQDFINGPAQHPEWLAELDRMCAQAHQRGLLLDRIDAYYAWNMYSISEHASWLRDPNLDSCLSYLVVVEITA